MTEELKPCPFCGGKEVKIFKEGSIWVVECLQCLAKVGATLEADALDFWNYRPKEEQLGEQIREMKQKNDALKREILEAREDNADNMEYHVAERERLKAENARLREALGKIIDRAEKEESKASNSTYGFAYDIEDIARDALKGWEND